MNEHEEAARRAKSIRLIAQLRTQLPDATTKELAQVTEVMSERMWHEVAELADVNWPSPVTIKQVITILRLQAEEDVRIAKAKARPGMVMADPFVGLT